MDYLEPDCNVEVKPSIVTLTAAVEAYSTKERGENTAKTSVELGRRSQEDGKANDTSTFSRGAVDETDDFEDFYETDKYTLICRISNRFYESIKHIMEQKSIGVAFQGQKLGRDGILSLIQVATDSELIIFDIVRLGNGAFIGGLQTVFESEHIMKVIHDCRWISDLLGHQHGIFIANVFDTQVANAFVYRALNEGNWPKHVESLPACLISHLELPAQDVYHTQFKERYSEENEVVWLVRPLPTEFLDAAYEDTIHLLRLQRVLLREMLVEFKAAVQIYLNFSTTAMEDMERCKVTRDLLPIAFTHIHMDIKRTSDHRMDSHTFNRQISQISCVDVPEKVVTFSQHSRLHEDGNLDGQEFSQTQSAAGQQSGAKITRASTDEKKKSRRRKAAKPQHSSQKQRSAKKIAICGDRDISESAGSISPADCSIGMSTDVDFAVASSSMGEDVESFMGIGSVSDVEEFSSADAIYPSSGTDKVKVVSALVSAPHDKSNIDGQELDASGMPTDIMAPNPSAVSQPLDFSYHKEVTGTLKIQEEKTASILAPCKLHTQEEVGTKATVDQTKWTAQQKKTSKRPNNFTLHRKGERKRHNGSKSSTPSLHHPSQQDSPRDTTVPPHPSSQGSGFIEGSQPLSVTLDMDSIPCSSSSISRPAEMQETGPREMADKNESLSLYSTGGDSHLSSQECTQQPLNAVKGEESTSLSTGDEHVSNQRWPQESDIYSNEKLSTVLSKGKETSPSSSNSTFRSHCAKQEDTRSYKCNVCLKLFACEFCLKMHEKQHEAHMINKYKCDLCNKSFSLSSVLREHLVHHFRDQPFKCDICAKTYINITGLKVHKESHTSERRWECSVCDQRFVKSNHLYAHERNHTGVKPYKCDFCNKMFSTFFILKRHSAKHSEVKLLSKCDLCHKYFKRLHSRIVTTPKKRHVRKCSYQCFVCKKTFCIKSLAEEHKRIHPPYKCDLCDKYFHSNRAMQCHKVTHWRSYECDVCEKSFANSKSLNEHRIRHSHFRYKCDICEKAFACVKNLKNHEATHLEQHKLSGKQYVCDVCGKCCRSRASFRYHMTTHSALGPYKCDTCQNYYSTMHGLKKHKQRHSNHKPYKCDVCGKCFTLPEDLTQHKEIHSGYRPYKCSQCDKTFVRSYHQRMHYKRIHAKEFSYQCDQCGRYFVEKGALSYHRTHAHKIIKAELPDV